MLILGIDPGTATTGYGFVKVEGSSYEAIKWGLIETNKTVKPERRLESIYKQTISILNEYGPNIMAIEKLFFATNAKTAMRVGQAYGVMLLAAAKTKTGVIEYAPGTIKKIVSGNGRADKKEVQKSVRKFLGADVRSKKKHKTHFDNAADALAVAVCHARIKNYSDKKPST
jgi:crossover junction endodeoxyribonuclease RuvC